MRIWLRLGITRISLLAFALAALVWLTLGRVERAQADGIVTACDDLSLRAALAGGGSVSFNCAGAPLISLGSQIVITADTTIDGLNGGATVALVGSKRIFSVTQNSTLTLTHLIVKDGTDTDGGCIYANGRLALDNVELTGCHSGANLRGGAIFVNGSGSATLDNTRIHDNVADLSGGGIHSLGMLSISNSSVNGNAAMRGGGIYADQAGGVLWSVTISGNQANFGGGGLFNAQGVMTLTQTSFIGNRATVNGGGLFNAQGVLTVTQSNFSRNSASGGGAIWNDGGMTSLSSSSFHGNTATNTGGGIQVEAGMLTLSSSSFDGSSAGYGAGIFNKATLVVSDATMSHNAAGVAAGGIRNDGTATLSNVMLSSNSAGTTGGGVDSGGTLTLTQSTLSGNSTGGTGGGLISRGTASVSDTSFTGNVAANGAGINNQGTATLSRLTINGNIASGAGGGIWSFGRLTLNDSTISGNSAINGAGFLNFSNPSSATLDNVTLSDNKATVSGGGVFNSSSITLRQITVSGNSASVEGGGLWSHGTLTLSKSLVDRNSGYTGGGINNQGAMTLNNSTVSRNTAVNGGGIYNDGSATLLNLTLSNRAPVTGTADNIYLFSGVLSLGNTILNAEGATHVNCFGAGLAQRVSLGHNLASDSTCNLVGSGDQQGPAFPILLGPLGIYNGLTLSMLPLVGSAAIDHGDNTICAAPPINNFDQRGLARPVNGTCDAGAVERQPNDIDLTPRVYLPLLAR